jgi:cellulose synthase/poly-beta-1,6-N-acetylglucosamine synthase-like glycosyltransferase
LTTDYDLIAEGVQAIDDEFLWWFSENPSCERAEVVKGKMQLNDDGQEYGFPDMSLYKIIIPQGEPKQETLEEVAYNYASKKLQRPITIYTSLDANVAEYVGFIKGAKWQQERMYSEEEVKQIIEATLIEYSDFVLADIPEWFEKFKKKQNEK